MKRLLPLMILLVLLAALSGCVSATPAPAPTQPAALQATSAPVATAVPVATTPAPANTTAASTAASTPAAPNAALLGTPEPTRAVTADLPVLNPNALKSYVATINLTEEATGSQATPQAPASIELRYNSQPAPGVYSYSSTGMAASGQGQDFKMVQSGTNTYVYVPEQSKWLSMPATSPDQVPGLGDVIDPNKLAQDAPQGLFAKQNVLNAHENVDGVDTTHYKATEAQTQELFGNTGDPTRTFVSGTADFWVANNGGYLKQYVLTFTLKDQQNQQFTQTIKLTVTNENKPVDISTPAPDQIISMDQYNSAVATAMAPAEAGSPTPGQ